MRKLATHVGAFLVLAIAGVTAANVQAAAESHGKRFENRTGINTI